MRPVSIVHGPDRLDPRTCGAYHGILPRGLERSGVDPAAWPALAPELDAALTGATTRIDAELVAVAHAEGVLSYAESADVAESFVRGFAADADRIELWSVREGHTSSVWRVALGGPAIARTRVLALDIARGSGAASAELSVIAAELARMHNTDPERVNRPLVVDDVERRNGRTVTVVVSEWLEGARELHVAPDGAWMAVDEFELCQGGTQQASGAHKTPAESDTCWEELVEITVAHSYSRDGLVCGARFEPNDGDFVEHEGQMRVIACSPPEPAVPLGEWVARCLLPSASCGSEPVVWPRMERALEVMLHAVQRNPLLPDAATCVEAGVLFAQTRTARSAGHEPGAPFPGPRWESADQRA